MRNMRRCIFSCDRQSGKRRSVARDERGVVSILLIFIVMVLFTVMSVFIDYARIAAMEWRAEVMGQAAARSILSAYDPELQRRYGLFAFGKSDPAWIAEQVLNDYQPRGKEVYGWINLEINKHDSVVERPIGRLEQFEQQILEEMKYKAPIQITYELLGKMKPVAGAMQEAVKITELMHAVSADYDKRNTELTRALKSQKLARDGISRSKMSRLLGDVNTMDHVTSVGNIDSVVDIVRQYDNYRLMVASDAILPPKKRKYKSSIENYVNRVGIIVSQFRHEVELVNKAHVKGLDQALRAVAEAKQINERMQAAIARIRAEQNSASFNQVADASIQNASASALSQTDSAKLKDMNGSIDKLILADEFFIQYESELQQQKQSIVSLMQEAHRMVNIIDTALLGTGSVNDVRSSINRINNGLETYKNDYIQHSSNLVLKREALINEQKASDDSRRQAEQEAGQKLKGANQLLLALANLSAVQEHQQAFQEVGQRADEIASFNSTSVSLGENGTHQSAQPQAEANEAMEGATALFDQLGEVSVGMRDRFYRNEYAYLYFPSYNPLQLQSLFKSKQMTSELTQSLSLENQELEYILYGFRNPAGNLAAAFGEIFAARLAVRTMEGLVERAGLTHPLAILAGAILYGLNMAMADLLDLVTTNSIPLSKYVPSITLNYSDYLRLFMMVQGDRREMSIRMLSVIERNTGIDMRSRGTYAVVDIEPRVKLWFLPGLIRVLGQGGLLGGRITNGYYEKKQRSAYSY